MKPVRLFLILALTTAWTPGSAAEPAPEPPPEPTIAAPAVPDGLEVRRARHAQVFARHAARLGVPAALVDAVAFVESAYRPEAVGGDGEVGLMQILPATAAMLGFRGDLAALREPDTNVRLGATYLAGAWEATRGDLCRTLMKYRAGHGEERMTPLSVAYCRRALAHLAAAGSPLAAGVALPAADAPGRGGGRPGFAVLRLPRAELARLRAGRRTPEDSRRYWAAHEARIRALTAAARARRPA